MPDDGAAPQMTATKTNAVVVFARHTIVRSIRCRAVIAADDEAPVPATD